VSILLTVYERLLADVCVLSGVPLGAPDEITYAWVLKEGPSLDKAILRYIEYGGEIPQSRIGLRRCGTSSSLIMMRLHSAT